MLSNKKIRLVKYFEPVTPSLQEWLLLQVRWNTGWGVPLGLQQSVKRLPMEAVEFENDIIFICVTIER